MKTILRQVTVSQKAMHVKSMSFLVFILFLNFNLLLSTSTEDQFALQGFGGTNLSLDGVATVMPNGLLMLTDGTHLTKGHMFHPAPFHFFASPNGTTVRSFSTTFVFGIISEYAQLSDQGLAFVVSPSKDLSTANVAQYFGLLNISNNGKASNHILAIELDTMLNPEFQEINSNHVGIDVNSLKSLQSHAAGYYDDQTGEFQNLSLISRKAMQVWVDYDGQAMQLNVYLAPVQVSKPKAPLLSTNIDLSMVVTDPAYVGFSSSTGVIFSCHYVLGWSFSLNGAAPPLDLSKLPNLPRTGSKPKSKVLDIVLPIATATFAVALLIAIFLVLRARLQYAEVHEDWEVEFGPYRFSYKDLFHATEGFQNKQLLGIGGFGRVYKGVLPASNLEIAVKKVSNDSKQGMKEFIAEVVSIGRLRHRNLVQLLGYCRRKSELLLVYDYMSNSSLDKHLYDKNKPVLDWAHRFQIIKGVASGLLYLHQDWEQVVIHRDIKASNVLLDTEMNGRLGDFGLARLYDHDTDPRTTRVVGTMGYLAPELVRTGKATPATDVFAFGVFLLEVTCGRRPLEYDMHDDQLVLLDLVLKHWREGSILDMVDRRLGGEYITEEASLVLKLGLLCSHPLPSARPRMRQVVQCMDGDMAVDPEVSPTYLSYSTPTLMQNEGFKSYVISNLLSPTRISAASDVSAMSSLSGGR